MSLSIADSGTNSQMDVSLHLLFFVDFYHLFNRCLMVIGIAINSTAILIDVFEHRIADSGMNSHI